MWPTHGQDCNHSDDHTCEVAVEPTPSAPPTTTPPTVVPPTPVVVPTEVPTAQPAPVVEPTHAPATTPTTIVPGIEATPSAPSTDTTVVEIRTPDAISEGRVLSTEPEVVRTPEQLPTVLPKAGDNISMMLLMLAVGGAMLVLLGAALRRA